VRNRVAAFRKNWLQTSCHTAAAGMVFLIMLAITLSLTSIVILYDLTSYHPVGETVPWVGYASSIGIVFVVSLLATLASAVIGITIDIATRPVSLLLRRVARYLLVGCLGCPNCKVCYRPTSSDCIINIYIYSIFCNKLLIAKSYGTRSGTSQAKDHLTLSNTRRA